MISGPSAVQPFERPGQDRAGNGIAKQQRSDKIFVTMQIPCKVLLDVT
jgi:hypothetical protein